jgi:hypothetical protein
MANAPLIVEGAKKLASMVRSKPDSAVAVRPPATGTFTGGPQSEFAWLQERIEQLEEEQRQSAELLRTMAETNAQMAQALEYLRARVRVNYRIAVVSLLGLVLLGGWMLLR